GLVCQRSRLPGRRRAAYTTGSSAECRGGPRLLGIPYSGYSSAQNSHLDSGSATRALPEHLVRASLPGHSGYTFIGASTTEYDQCLRCGPATTADFLSRLQQRLPADYASRTSRASTLCATL